MTEIEFRAIAAQGYNRIPLLLECFADLDTPLSLYLKLAQQPYSFLLESVVGGERFGRYSFIGLPASTIIRSTADGAEVVKNGATIERFRGNPLDFVDAWQKRFKVAVRPGLPRFCGGLAGYFAYDAVRHIEPRAAGRDKRDPVGVPDVFLLLTEELAIVDNVTGKIYLMVYADPAEGEAYQRARRRLRELYAQLARPLAMPSPGPGIETGTRREFARDDYLAAVARAKEYITAGDVMQVQVGQLIEKPFRDSPLTLYRALRSINPSPYMYFYDLGEFHIVGASPEILVRQERQPDGDRITIRPLAGTRRRGATPAQDEALAQELLADPKEIAEHVMLIDLARNDVGRIAETGSVRVTDRLAIEKYSHVMHIVSNVEGKLEPGTGPIDVLRATFPAGTLTGAPKIRAMQIIDELEPTRRSIYGGACGYISFLGDLELAIAIRTAVVKDGTLYVQAAAGVVADSVPENEWQETENKARAVLRAAELVQTGLDGQI
ncbi:MAG: anthranilate synthase component I [Burkholderiaceae bacterium]|nr:anthranilate synthase component I [Burkholderiaceae bacterium]MEB2352687.1 anthranilate synthase component I [Burkholderiaceae bacterium]